MNRIVLAIVIAFLATGGASAYTLKTIYRFCSPNGCWEGQNPTGYFAMDSAGVLYGTTVIGGRYSRGTVFELVPNSEHTKWKHKLIHDFCGGDGCEDGENPVGNLVIDTAGNIYGTTADNWPSKGSAFRLVPNAKHTKWKFEMMHLFCPEGGNSCPDGANPAGGLTYAGATTGAPYDGVSPLYGTTEFGGTAGYGVVYELDPIPGKNTWRENVLYSFCALANCVDGLQPAGGLIVDGSKVLFGESVGGGNFGDGTVFKLTNRTSNWTETVLHSFCVSQLCPDGEYPDGGLTMDANRNLFGFTGQGGENFSGTFFELNADRYRFSTLFSFCGSPVNCTPDAGDPMGAPFIEASGNFLGHTDSSDINTDGSIFELTAGPNPQISLIYNFGKHFRAGGIPVGSLFRGPDDVLYGATDVGGNSPFDGGTIFELVP